MNQSDKTTSEAVWPIRECGFCGETIWRVGKRLVFGGQCPDCGNLTTDYGGGFPGHIGVSEEFLAAVQKARSAPELRDAQGLPPGRPNG